MAKLDPADKRTADAVQWVKTESELLTRVHIQHFRQCDNVSLEDIGPVTALVGRNGAGKSNILKAIWQTAQIASSGQADLRGINLATAGGLFAVTVEFSLDDGRYEYSLTIEQNKPIVRERLRLSNGGGQSRVVLEREGGIVRFEGRAAPLAIADLAASLPSLIALLPAMDEVVRTIQPARSFLAAIRYYPLDEPGDLAMTPPIADVEYVAWAARYEASGAAGDNVSFRILHLFLKKPQDFQVLTSLLGRSGLGLIDDITVATLNAGKTKTATGVQDNTYYFIRFFPSRGSGAIPMAIGLEGLSLGTRRVLRMLVSALFDRSSVMLLEQPEDSLHQGLTKSLIGLLRQNLAPTQLVMSSHSSVLLNQVKPEEIRLVSLHGGMTNVRRLTSTELRIAEDFMNEQGPLYDFLESLQED